jgi:tetratricopeptide (TPR) repeat protein
MVFGFDGRLSLNPSYNISIDVKPSMRYGMALGSLEAFDGFYFGVGFGASYRFGRDPDAPLPDVRAIRFGELRMPPVFAAMQSVYVNEPIAEIELTNTEEAPISEVTVLFNQQQFMDSPTSSASVEIIRPGESVKVPIHASFNGGVFTTNGITPVNGELIVRYSFLGRPLEQRTSVSFDLHDRNALTWDDDRKIAAFMTYSDSAVRNYSSFIRSVARAENTDYLPDSLEFGMQAYHALSALGILYQPDPSAPFTQVQENTLIVDSVNLPRETLRNITGDCDDLTVLYNTMLETVGIPTGFVTLPGHIYTAINTELPPEDYAMVHPDREMSMEHDGTLWILVEITLVGQSNFLDAWRTGMTQWKNTPEEFRSFNVTAASQSLFRPVGLIESDLGLQYGDPEEFLRDYRSDLERLSGGIIAPLRDRAQSRNQPRAWNHLGVIAGRLGQIAVAEDAFENAARLDPEYVNPLVNQGSLEFMQRNYTEAVTAYERAARLLESLPDMSESPLAVSVYLNLSRALYAVNLYEEAGEYVARAEAIDSGRAAEYGYIAARESGGARAANRAAEPILFVDDDAE